MDKIKKFYKALHAREKIMIDEIIDRIRKKDFVRLDLKKLEGKDGFYRVRKGVFRIIFFMKNDRIVLVAIDRKSEDTYSFI